MRLPKHFLCNIVIFCIILNTISVDAQSVTTDSLLKKAFKTDELLPILISSAIKFSPQTKIDASNVTYATENVRVVKKAIFNTVYLLSNYNYGNNYSSLNSQSLNAGGYNYSAQRTAFYNVGIGLQLPITQIISRKNYIGSSNALLSSSLAEKEKSAFVIKETVISMYQDMKLQHKLMDISIKNKQALQVNNSMAEKDFLNGEITVDQVSKVLESYNLSVITFETYVNKFQTSYMLLESFTGTNLSKLIMSIK